MRSSLARPLQIVALVAATTAALAAGPARAQLGDPRGPGESAPPPPAMCAQTISCTYSERNYLPSGYRFQSLQVCGANCTTQYWVRNMPDDQVLLSTDPVRGGGLVTVQRATDPNDTHPGIRIILPHYTPSDAACCPSGYQDITYTWDPATATLVASSATIIPTADFGGWETELHRLESAQFFKVFGD
jgi:hypothetical protein